MALPRTIRRLNNIEPYAELYGVCSTAGSTAAKVVTIDNFNLETGTPISVKFTNKNTAAAPTLNVSDTGAFPICYLGKTISSSLIKANSIQKLTYDGTNWEIAGQGTGSSNYYAVCSTAGSTAAKTVTVEDFELLTGTSVSIKFDNTDTSTSPTLNVNNTGAHPIYYNGATLGPSILKAGSIQDFVYDGTNWVLTTSGEITYVPTVVNSLDNISITDEDGLYCAGIESDGTYTDSTFTISDGGNHYVEQSELNDEGINKYPLTFSTKTIDKATGTFTSPLYYDGDIYINSHSGGIHSNIFYGDVISVGSLYTKSTTLQLVTSDPYALHLPYIKFPVMEYNYVKYTADSDHKTVYVNIPSIWIEGEGNEKHVSQIFFEITNGYKTNFIWPGTIKWLSSNKPPKFIEFNSTDIIKLTSPNDGDTWFGEHLNEYSNEIYLNYRKQEIYLRDNGGIVEDYSVTGAEIADGDVKFTATPVSGTIDSKSVNASSITGYIYASGLFVITQDTTVIYSKSGYTLGTDFNSTLAPNAADTAEISTSYTVNNIPYKFIWRVASA